MELISDYYRQQNKDLHESPKLYGHRGNMHLPKVQELLKIYQGKTVLDYGCGKADLDRVAPFPVVNYDPAIDEYSKDPKPCDVLICTDVLEHIEPDYLENVLTHIREKTIKVGYFVINTREDISKTLPDGTNPHKIQEPNEWWILRIKKHFNIVKNWVSGVHAYFIVQ